MSDYDNQNRTEQAIAIAENRLVNGVSAKAVAPYGITTTSGIMPMPLPLIDVAFDYIGWSNPDVNDNYQTIQFKQGGAAGTTVVTLSLTYDASNNITSLARS